MTQLVAGLSRRVGLCQHREQFSSVALTVMGALEYWCRQVEESLGPVRWGQISPETRHLFEVITFDEGNQGA
jgi:hypothetical protein